MKTFREWVELREAGFLSRIFGGGSAPSAPVGTSVTAKFPERVPAAAQSVAKKSVYDGPWAGRKPMWFDDLFGLLDGVEETRYLLEKIPTRGDAGRVQSDLYDIYYKLSMERGRGRSVSGLSDSDCSRAMSLIEGVLQREYGMVAFPTDAEMGSTGGLVRPYKDVDPKEVSLVSHGELESGPYRVLVKGFRGPGGRVVQARVDLP
jgi:hypothetical protein